MSFARILVAASLLPALAHASTGPTVIRDTGRYPVSVAIDSSILPIPVPGTPRLGPNLYTGVLTVRDNGSNVEARFQGTDVKSGDPLTIRCRFDPTWTGFTIGDVPVDGEVARDVVTDLDPEKLTLMRIDGVGVVDGFTGQVIAELGPGPSLVRWAAR